MTYPLKTRLKHQINILTVFLIKREKALRDFENYKIKAIENEENLTLSHKEELIDMNKMLLDLRDDQDKQLKRFDLLTNKFNSEKVYLIEDLKSKHRIEIENLKQSFVTNKDSMQAEKNKLEERHEKEINKIRSELEAVHTRMNTDKSEYEQNTFKLKTFYEKELEANRNNSNNQYTQLINSLKSEMEKLNKDKIFFENQMNNRFNQKLEEILDKEQEIKHLKETLNGLQSNLGNSDSVLTSLNEKVF